MIIKFALRVNVLRIWPGFPELRTGAPDAFFVSIALDGRGSINQSRNREIAVIHQTVICQTQSYDCCSDFSETAKCVP